MRIRACPFLAILVLSTVVCLEVEGAIASQGGETSRSGKDIDSIDRNNTGHKNLGNWYSIAQEKEMGKQYSAEIERSFKVLDDRALTDYLTRIAENIAKNSDAQMPITVRLLDIEQIQAFTLPGGYQYVSRGLLLRLESESELAGVLARGIAHTALRSAARLMTRANWANVGNIPLIFVGPSVPPNRVSGLNIPLTWLSLNRGFEQQADYVGAQYLYKAGYSAEGLVRAIERIWPTTPLTAKAFSPFPPTPDRVKALRKEIDRLPKRAGEIASTPEFDGFEQRLRSWKPTEPVSTPSLSNPQPQ